MSVDGTYGRLSSHNARIKELKYKKNERKKNMHATIRLVGSSENSFKKFDSETIESVKSKIRERAQSKKRKNNIITTFLFIIGLTFVIFFVKLITSI